MLSGLDVNWGKSLSSWAELKGFTVDISSWKTLALQCNFFLSGFLFLLQRVVVSGAQNIMLMGLGV
jgi:hypothetical protein